MRRESVDDAGALRHQPLAHPVQRLQIQLLRGLGRTNFIVGRCTASAIRFGIIEVVLLSLAIGRTYLAGINLAS